MRAGWLVGILAALSVAGCRARSADTLVFAVGGTPRELAFWDKLVPLLSREAGVPVELHHQPTDTDQQRQGLLIALKSKQPHPDVFLMDVAWLTQFAASGWLEPLDDWAARDRVDRAVFFPSVIDRIDRYRGRLVALPLEMDGGVLYYRADILKRYADGPPRTWSEFERIARRAEQDERRSNPDFYAYVWQGAQYEGLVCHFLEVATALGGGISLTDAGISVATEPNRRALEMMQRFVRDGLSPPQTTEMKEEDARQFFQNGNALFERNWPYAWLLHNAAGSPVKGRVGIAPLPGDASALGGWHLGVSRYSKNKEAAWRLVRTLVSFDLQKAITFQLGVNPARRDVYQDAGVLRRMPQLAALRPVFENATPRPVSPYYTEMSDPLQRWLNAALSGRVSARAALEAAQEEETRIHRRYSEGT